MIMRTWTTGVDERRSEEYATFAEERSLPMFRAHAGFRGLVYARAEGSRTVVTFWDDHAAVSNLERSAEYRETVAAILAAGFLREPQTVAVQDVDFAELPDRPGAQHASA
jgi:heme-degrading monooxygenase HmoA